MEDIRFNAFYNTIEEICFLAHLLIANEKTENELIIKTFVELKNEDILNEVDWLENVGISFLLNMKAAKLFVASDYIRGAPETEEDFIDDGLVDHFIKEYYTEKKKIYCLQERRIEYLKEEIKNGLLY